MNVFEGMYGTSRSSYLKLENARMIVRHTTKIDETKMGARARHVESIFVENDIGERHHFPTTNLLPARAMTQHVSHGGTFADQVGQHIVRMAEDFANLGKASRHIFNNTNNLHESAMIVREACRNKIREMRKVFERMYRESGYTAECQKIMDEASKLNETEKTPKPISVRKMNEMRRIMMAEGIEAPSDEVVESACRCMDEDYLQAPKEGAAPPLSDAKDDEDDWDGWNVKPGQVRYAGMPAGGKNGQTGSTTAGSGGSGKKFVPSRPAGDRTYPRIVRKESIAVKNPVIREFADWINQFAIDNILNEDPLTGLRSSPSSWDGDEHDDALDRVVNDFNLDDFMMSPEARDIVGQAGEEDAVLSKDEIMSCLDSYLRAQIENQGGGYMDDVSSVSSVVYHTVETELKDRGVEIVSDDDARMLTDECADGDNVIISREDVLLPKDNQGEDLGREVLAPTVIDPTDNRNEVPTNSGYIDRLLTLAGRNTGF